MKSEDFIKQLVELMDTDAEINLSTKLADVEDWDSLSMVSFFSFCNTTLKRHVTPDEIKSARTVEDLFKLVN
jgi:acyl carrier protein